MFWILELYDIYVPKDSYTLELQRLGSIAYTDQDNENDMKYSSHSDIKENRKHRQGGRRVEETLFLLEEEMRNHERHFQKIQNLLYEKKSLFFASTRKNWPIVFLQLCLIPRCISSFSDASFCSRFIEILLELDPPDLRIVPLFHYLLVNVGQIALCLSEVRIYAVVEYWS